MFFPPWSFLLLQATHLHFPFYPRCPSASLPLPQNEKEVKYHHIINISPISILISNSQKVVFMFGRNTSNYSIGRGISFLLLRIAFFILFYFFKHTNNNRNCLHVFSSVTMLLLFLPSCDVCIDSLSCAIIYHLWPFSSLALYSLFLFHDSHNIQKNIHVTFGSSFKSTSRLLHFYVWSYWRLLFYSILFYSYTCLLFSFLLLISLMFSRRCSLWSFAYTLSHQRSLSALVWKQTMCTFPEAWLVDMYTYNWSWEK